MTLPEKTSQPHPKRRRREKAPVRENGRRPQREPRRVEENESTVDRPLYRTVPDKRLQRDALLWVSLALIASLAAVCVVAIATSSVPTALVSATGILAAALLLIVRYAFPRRPGTA